MTRRRTKRIWSTDPIDQEAGFPDAKDVWLKLCGEQLDLSRAVERFDGGDHIIYYMSNGYAYTMACDGETIHRYEEVL